MLHFVYGYMSTLGWGQGKFCWRFLTLMCQMKGMDAVKCLLMVLMLAVFFGQNVSAEQTELRAAEVVVTTGVQERMPVDAIQSYVASVETLFCYSRITGARSEATVWHVWYHEGEEMVRISLPVRSPNWRTWSRKTIPAGGRGVWRVEVLDDQGGVLGSQDFSLL